MIYRRLISDASLICLLGYTLVKLVLGRKPLVDPRNKLEMPVDHFTFMGGGQGRNIFSA